LNSIAGYGANLQKAFGIDDDHKWLRYLKTHDYHRLLQHILPVTIIGLAIAKVQDVIWSLGTLLRWVCSKEIFLEDIPRMKVIVAKVLYKLERVFPPSLFDCQVHLLVHLVDEVAIVGPVHCRWMYWLERYMAVLKGYVCNRARVERSMATRHLATESMFYYSNILATIDPSCSHEWMEDREEEEDSLTSAIKTRLLLPTELIQLTTFMLNNSNVMEEWRNFYENAKNMSGRSRSFPIFHNFMKENLAHVDKLLAQENGISYFPEVTNDVCAIVHGPLRIVTTRSAMWIKEDI
jgi:hypothetical protein